MELFAGSYWTRPYNMPSYSFKCPTCEATVTVTQDVSDNPKVPKCLNCEIDMTRVYGGLSVQFRGGGWGSSRG